MALAEIPFPSPLFKKTKVKLFTVFLPTGLDVMNDLTVPQIQLVRKVHTLIKNMEITWCNMANMLIGGSSKEYLVLTRNCLVLNK